MNKRLHYEGRERHLAGSPRDLFPLAQHDARRHLAERDPPENDTITAERSQAQIEQPEEGTN